MEDAKLFCNRNQEVSLNPSEFPGYKVLGRHISPLTLYEDPNDRRKLFTRLKVVQNG